jgi:hypothetical protein
MRSSARNDRLAAALKENLKRRKARARTLKSAPKPAGEAPAPDAAAPPQARPNIAAGRD